MLLRLPSLPWLAALALLPTSLVTSSCDDRGVEALACGDGRVDEPEQCDDGAENGSPGRCERDCTTPRFASVEGDVLAFMTEVRGERVEGATVSVLERPELSVVTGADAHFRFDGLQVGRDVTLVVEHPDFKSTQTATLTLGPNGIDPFSVQLVPKGIFTALSTLVPLPLDEAEHCVIATTAARLGGSLYVYLRQGAPGTRVWLEPEAPAESGPIYFDESVLPNAEQPATSTDGGVLFYRVPPGDYMMRASRDRTEFNEVRFACRAGWIVNAGPPLGLLANVTSPDHGLGALRAPDAYSAASDALCEATQACVNEEAGAVHYPDATLASCKAMFANTWAWLDEACAESSGVADAAKQLYDCRAAGPCDVTLGGDDVCVAEESAFAEAELAYGDCLLASRPD